MNWIFMYPAASSTTASLRPMRRSMGTVKSWPATTISPA